MNEVNCVATFSSNWLLEVVSLANPETVSCGTIRDQISWLLRIASADVGLPPLVRSGGSGFGETRKNIFKVDQTGASGLALPELLAQFEKEANLNE